MNNHQPTLGKTHCILRINPRRPYIVGTNGLKRIVLGASTERHAQAAPIPRSVPAKPLRTTQPATQHFLVILQCERGRLDEHAKEVIASAALFANERTAVVVAVIGDIDVNLLAGAGADKVIVLAEPDLRLFCPEKLLAIANSLVNRYQPRHIFIPDRHPEGDFGRRLAARTQQTVATDVVEIGADYVLRAIPGGQYSRGQLPHLLLLARHVADTRLPFVGKGEIETAPLLSTTFATATAIAIDRGIELLGAENNELEEADFILSAGGGVRDLPTFNSLAGALNASVGASRVAVDEGHFNRDRQVGATGKTVQSNVYMALGISGAVQHLQGIKECNHVIAVNIDAGAPIAKRADLMVIEDAQALMTALLSKIHEAGRIENAT